MQQEIFKPNWREVCRVYNALFSANLDTVTDQYGYLIDFIAHNPDIVEALEDSLRPPPNVVNIKKEYRL